MKKNNNRKSSVRFSVDQTLVQGIKSRILMLLSRKDGTWNGTMTELNRAITAGLRRSTPNNWPKSPSVLRRVVNVVVPSLRAAGVSVQFGRTTDHSRTRFVSLVMG